MNKKIIKQYLSDKEKINREVFVDLFNTVPIEKKELLSNLYLFIKRQDISRLLFLNELYQKMIETHGIIMEFGTRYGRNMALFESLRGIYEPYNHNRKIIGFDTFHGFPSIHIKDGIADIVKKGSYSVQGKNYVTYLEKILYAHEEESPIAHIKKFEIRKGDIIKTLPHYLNDNPETIIALAYFYLDLYTPTKKCLHTIIPYLVQGSILVFDELNHHDFPGETLALKELFDLKTIHIQKSKYATVASYIII